MESSAVIMTGKLLEMVCIIIFAGALSARFSKWARLPDVVVFILAGVLLGPSAANLISFDNAVVNQVILTFGASYILFDGGREIRLHILNWIKFSVTSLATVGVLISAFITAGFAMAFLHIDFLYALLLGSVIASTDPSVLVPLFKKINVSDKLKQTIIAESAFNDAAGAIVTFAVLGVIAGGSFSLGHSVLELLKEAGGGIAVGIILGFVTVHLISEAKHGILSDFPSEVVVASVIASYMVASRFGFSGFMAVFVFGIMVGNIDSLKVTVPEDLHEMHLHFKEALISIIRMMIFVLLGVHIDFGVLAQYGWGAFAVVMLFIFIARPVSVFVSLLPNRKAKWSWQETVYLMWVRETGVIPAALAGMLVTMNVRHSDIISAVTFMAIILTLTLQASSSAYLARILKLEKEQEPEAQLQAVE